jgi:hypothetical protein
VVEVVGVEVGVVGVVISRSEAEGGKTTLERIIPSCDELIMEMSEEYGLNCMGENDDDEDEDDDDERNTVAPPAPTTAAVP